RSGNLFTTRIGSFTFGFFGRSGHPLAGRTLSMDEFSDARHIAVDADSSVTTVIERWLKARRIRRHVVVRTSHFHCIPDIMRMSDLIAVVPTNFRGAWLYGGQAARIMPPLKMPPTEIRAYWHRSVNADARHKWWRRVIVGELRK